MFKKAKYLESKWQLTTDHHHKNYTMHIFKFEKLNHDIDTHGGRMDVLYE